MTVTGKEQLGARTHEWRRAITSSLPTFPKWDVVVQHEAERKGLERCACLLRTKRLNPEAARANALRVCRLWQYQEREPRTPCAVALQLLPFDYHDLVVQHPGWKRRRDVEQTCNCSLFGTDVSIR